MANYPRYARAGNKWTDVDLTAYNISIQEQTLAKFFGISSLPALDPSLAAFSSVEHHKIAPDDETYKLLYLRV